MTEERKGDLIEMRYHCPVCGGDGTWREGDEEVSCSTCSGTGLIAFSAYWDKKRPRSFDRIVTKVKMNRRRRTKKPKTEAKPWSTLVGKFFHTFTTDLPRERRGDVQNQGVVLSDLGNGYLLVQLFDFIRNLYVQGTALLTPVPK